MGDFNENGYQKKKTWVHMHSAICFFSSLITGWDKKHDSII